MSAPDVSALFTGCLLTFLKVGLPILCIALIVGLAISFLQAITQINEATLAFLPKLLVVGLSMSVLGPFMGRALAEFSAVIFDKIVAVGGL
jgi:flagellar biosynthesis protein FliQ